MDWIAIVSGFGVGAIAGLTGVGGGSPTTPLLSAFKLNPAVAIGTDLRFAAVTKAAGPVSHHQAGHVQWRITGLLLGAPVSLSSIGAGAIGATLILLLYPRLESHQIVGTDIAHAVPLTLVAGIGHAPMLRAGRPTVAMVGAGAAPLAPAVAVFVAQAHEPVPLRTGRSVGSPRA